MLNIQTPEQLSLTLRAARRLRKLTQAQLALAAGVSARFVMDLESGKPTLRVDSLLRVIAALGGELKLAGLPVASIS